MAQSVHFEDNDDFFIATRSQINMLGAVHEPVGASPYVGLYMQVTASGSPESLGTTGRLRIEAVYTDSSTEDILTSDAPFNGYSIPSNTTAWVRFNTSGTASGAAEPANNSSITSTFQHGLDVTKTLRRIRYYWTED